MIKNLLYQIVPFYVLKFLFPFKFAPKFIKVFDDFAKKPLFLYLRHDSFMERVINEKGLYGDWEKESLKIWGALSKKADTIIDIGANTGIFSLLSKNNNPDAKVIAIEPIDINFEILTKNLIQNNFDIYTEKIALSDSKGVANMFMLKDALNYMTSINDNRYELHPEVQGHRKIIEVVVPTDTFANIYAKYQLTSINLIKIDVEGHEVAVLKSMMPLIEKHRPSVLIEVIGDDNAIIIQEMFDKLNYIYISIDEITLSKKVNKIWDNDHHNFLLCNEKDYITLLSHNLIES